MVSQSVNKTALHPKGVEYVPTFSTLKLIGIVNSPKWCRMLTIPFQAPSRAH
jgi:hypothetical protein